MPGVAWPVMLGPLKVNLKVGPATMNESKTTVITRAGLTSARAAGQSRTAVARVQAAPPYVWDGVDEDERPLSREEMQTGIVSVAPVAIEPTDET